MTLREIEAALEAMSKMSRRTICGLTVERGVDIHFRATLPNGTLTSWWRSNAMATILDSWSRPTQS